MAAGRRSPHGGEVDAAGHLGQVRVLQLIGVELEPWRAASSTSSLARAWLLGSHLEGSR